MCEIMTYTVEIDKTSITTVLEFCKANPEGEKFTSSVFEKDGTLDSVQYHYSFNDMMRDVFYDAVWGLQSNEICQDIVKLYDEDREIEIRL